VGIALLYRVPALPADDAAEYQRDQGQPDHQPDQTGVPCGEMLHRLGQAGEVLPQGGKLLLGLRVSDLLLRLARFQPRYGTGELT
jgi:hypothetical protein